MVGGRDRLGGMTAPSQPCRVAIVGGGIAGLSLATALDPTRFEVTVHEAQPERRTTGAALGLWASSRRVLESLGVRVPQAAYDTRVVLHRLDGRRLLTLRGPDVAQVRRPDLMTALAAAVPPSVRFDAGVVEHPERLDADVVVGADGVRSRVRGLVDGRAAERRATPWVTLRGVAPQVGGADESLLAAREFWGRSRLFGDAPVSGGRYWFTAHRSELGPEPLDLHAVLDEARHEFARAAPLVRDAVAHADDTTLATRLWVAPPMRRYVRGRFVVIGDAAHAACPNLGRGASDAILDAVTLAEILAAGRSLRTWQRRRLPVTQLARATAGLGMRVATA